MPMVPLRFTGNLGIIPQFFDVYAENLSIFHPDHAIHDYGVHVVSDSAFDKALNWVAHRTVTEAVSAHEIDQDDIGLCSWV